MRYWILRFARPVCVEGDDFDKTSVPNVRELQLVFADGSYYKKYRALVQQRAQFRVVGTLFHRQTGHHVTKILVNVKSFAPMPK